MRPTTSRTATRDVSGAARAAALAAGLCLLPGCVTYVVEDDPDLAVVPLDVTPVTVPLRGGSGDPQARAVDDYYADVVAQMQRALVDRELDLLRALVASHDRPAAPAWARGQIARFQRLADGLQWETEAARDARLELATKALPALGAELTLALRIPRGARTDIALIGADRSESKAARFLVSWSVVDTSAFDDQTRREFDDVVTLPETVDFAAAGAELRLPYTVPGLAPEGVRRVVEIRIDLLPGTLRLRGDDLPNARVALARQSFVIWPLGIDSVRDNPYAHLRAAVESGEPSHFANLYVAAWLMSPDYREDALRKLVEGLRVGTPELGRACTAGLRVLTGERIAVGDRDGWLRWWQGRAVEPAPAGDPDRARRGRR
ncbi:MAG: hypothetical protein IPM29_19745 [Planctomycetes bacterium]|nr:hypothetical protein [Planctomycetota bacterium]